MTDTTALAPDTAAHEECAATIAELEGKWKRAVADAANREKELARDREEFAKWATADLLRDVLPIGDALLAAGDTHAELQKLFFAFLKRHGVERVGAVGDRVDYLLHEVVGTRKEEGREAGFVLEVAHVGYTMHGRLLRPARIIMSE